MRTGSPRTDVSYVNNSSKKKSMVLFMGHEQQVGLNCKVVSCKNNLVLVKLKLVEPKTWSSSKAVDTNSTISDMMPKKLNFYASHDNDD